MLPNTVALPNVSYWQHTLHYVCVSVQIVHSLRWMVIPWNELKNSHSAVGVRNGNFFECIWKLETIKSITFFRKRKVLDKWFGGYCFRVARQVSYVWHVIPLLLCQRFYLLIRNLSVQQPVVLIDCTRCSRKLNTSTTICTCIQPVLQYFSELQTPHACGKTLSLDSKQKRKSAKEVVVRNERDGFCFPSAILTLFTKCSRNAVRFRILSNIRRECTLSLCRCPVTKCMRISMNFSCTSTVWHYTCDTRKDRDSTRAISNHLSFPFEKFHFDYCYFPPVSSGLKQAMHATDIENVPKVKILNCILSFNVFAHSSMHRVLRAVHTMQFS